MSDPKDDERIKGFGELGAKLGRPQPPPSGPGSGQRRGGPAERGDRGGRPNAPASDDDAWMRTYLREGYFREGDGGYLRPEFLTDTAQRIARAFKEQRINTAQVRAFFSEVRRAERMLKSGAPFEAVQVRLARLEPAVNNRRERGSVKQIFQTFIDQNSREARKGKKQFLEGFVLHFEAVVGFLPKDRG